MRPKAPKIMVIRHAEKPNGQATGVKESGEPSSRDLTVRGWQRAGALDPAAVAEEEGEMLVEGVVRSLPVPLGGDPGTG